MRAQKHDESRYSAVASHADSEAFVLRQTYERTVRRLYDEFFFFQWMSNQARFQNAFPIIDLLSGQFEEAMMRKDYRRAMRYLCALSAYGETFRHEVSETFQSVERKFSM